MRYLVGVILGLLVQTVAWGAPLVVRHGHTIRVAIGGHTSDAFALRAQDGGAGWRLEIAGGATGGTLALRDVTDGFAGAQRFELPLAGASVVLDPMRFRADHAYRVELRRGTTVVGSGLIYLQPPRRARGPLRFDDSEAAAPVSDDELTPSDKGAL